MAGKTKTPGKDADLRQRAEAVACTRPTQACDIAEALPLEEAQRLIHELRVHQIELEMQNDELHRTQRELEAARADYFDLYELAPVGYCVIKEQGVILQTNRAAAAMLGVSWQQLVGQSITRFIANSDRDAYHLFRKRCAETGEPEICELRMVGNDGTPFWVQFAAAATRDAGGAPVLRIVLSDISERKLAERALTDADQRKNEFLAMLAHELRNPLAPISNAAFVIGRLELEEPRVRWAQQIIEKQVSYLTRMVDDLLDAARIVQGKTVIKKEVFEFVALAETVVETAKLLADKKAHQLDVRLPERGVWLEGDPARLSQVLFNLMDNAIKYTPKGGRIEFSARADGEGLEIRVRDNGIGIPETLLPRVFDLFQQDERTLDRPQGGLGIGLTLVHDLIAKHGGRVEAYSEGSGKGATFTIWLPMLAPPDQLPAADAQIMRNPSMGMRVLVVDDSEAVVDSTAALLDLEGYGVRTASSGQDALDLVPAFKPQIVLLDIGLKDMDGFELATRLRALPGGADAYLVAITGYGDAETKARAFASGCNHFAVKPLSGSDLCELLAKARLG